MVTTALEQEGYIVIKVADVLHGMKQLYEAYLDLIIMTRELPTVNGEDPYLRILEACYLPVIAVGAAEDAVEMLELGADAYMTKPLNLRELVARVKALLRWKLRHDPSKDNPGAEIKNPLTKEGNNSTGLTSTEFRIFSGLVCNRGKLLNYRQLVNEVWGGEKVSLDTLHFHMRHLHRKLQDCSIGSIVGFRGVGYQWKERQLRNPG